MSGSFIESIARKTNVPAAEAKARVEEFSKSIRSVLESNGHCQIDGLGEFEQSGGRIRFRPAEELVNVLKTVSPVLPDYAVPAPGGATAPITAPIAPGTTPAPDREAARPVERTKPEVEKEQPSPPTAKPQGQDWTIDRDPIVTRRVSSSLDPSSKPSPSEDLPIIPVGKAATPKASPSEVKPPEFKDPEQPSKIPAEPTSKSATTSPSTRLPARQSVKVSRKRGARNVSARQSDGGRTSLLILGAAAVLILGVVALTQFGLWPVGSNSDTEVVQNETLNTEQPSSLGNASGDETTDSTGAVGAPATEQAPAVADGNPASNESVPAASLEQETTVPGTESYSLDTSMSGYTVVVGSSVSRSEADAAMTRFADLGLPYGVLEYQDDGLTRYRLGVGLFSTSEIADSVRQARPDDLPVGSWVLRIR